MIAQAQKRVAPLFLLVEALLWLMAAWLVLDVLPGKLYRRLLPTARAADNPPQTEVLRSMRPAAEIAPITRAIWRASHAVPFRSVCFHRGIAAQGMLKRRGIPSMLHYGVGKAAKGSPLQAHVWVSSNGQDVIGTAVEEDFQEIALFRSEEMGRARNATSMKTATHLFIHASPEFRLVAACCRRPGDASRSEAVEQALQRPLQWANVLFLMQRHRVAGLVADALCPCSAVPQEVRQALAKAKQEILLANMRALRTEVQLAAKLQQAGIAFAVLKGLPLTVQVYGSLGLRQSRDIDLLVKQTDVPALEQVLHSAGYRRSGTGAQIAPWQQELWTANRKHFEYAGPPGATSLEVHWRTTDNPYLFQVPDLFHELESVQVAPGITLPVLSRGHLLLDLCLHGAGHAWFRLKWIADIHALLVHAGDSGQQNLLTTAARHGLKRPVLQAMHLCSALFGLRLVEAANRLSTPEKLLIGIAAAALLQEDLSSPSATSDYVPKNLVLCRLLLRKGWRYRLREIQLNLTAPADWQQVRLSKRMQWMYPLLRFPLWLKRRWFDRFSGFDRH